VCFMHKFRRKRLQLGVQAGPILFQPEEQMAAPRWRSSGSWRYGWVVGCKILVGYWIVLGQLALAVHGQPAHLPSLIYEGQRTFGSKVAC